LGCWIGRGESTDPLSPEEKIWISENRDITGNQPALRWPAMIIFPLWTGVPIINQSAFPSFSGFSVKGMQTGFDRSW